MIDKVEEVGALVVCAIFILSLIMVVVFGGFLIASLIHTFFII